jgi:hypothetical protein
MLCKYCNSAGCEEECIDFCMNCNTEIKLGEDFCSDYCENVYGKLEPYCDTKEN